MDNGALIETLNLRRSLCCELKLQIINMTALVQRHVVFTTSERFNNIGKCAAFENSTMQLYRKDIVESKICAFHVFH